MKLEFSKDELKAILLDCSIPLGIRQMFLERIDIIEKFDNNQANLRSSLLGIKE